jgi:hypothetical protein
LSDKMAAKRVFSKIGITKCTDNHVLNGITSLYKF